MVPWKLEKLVTSITTTTTEDVGTKPTTPVVKFIQGLVQNPLRKKNITRCHKQTSCQLVNSLEMFRVFGENCSKTLDWRIPPFIIVLPIDLDLNREHFFWRIHRIETSTRIEIISRFRLVNHQLTI